MGVAQWERAMGGNKSVPGPRLGPSSRRVAATKSMGNAQQASPTSLDDDETILRTRKECTTSIHNMCGIGPS